MVFAPLLSRLVRDFFCASPAGRRALDASLMFCAPAPLTLSTSVLREVRHALPGKLQGTTPIYRLSALRELLLEGEVGVGGASLRSRRQIGIGIRLRQRPG